MALPQEVKNALDQGMQESEDYRIKEAWEGWLIYKNLIDTPPYRATFFPYAESQDPIIAEPITSSIVNRLVSALRKQASYKASINGQDVSPELAKLQEQLRWHQLSMDALAKTLATGGQLFWLTQDQENKVQVNLIQPYYAGKVFDPNFKSIGFYQCYTTDTRTMLTPIDNYTGADTHTVVRYVNSTSYMKWVNGKLLMDQPHNLPFTPAVWADCIDLDENGLYGVPYSNRFKSLLMQLNATLSQKQKALLFLQNIWVAKVGLTPSAGDEELTLKPNVINYLEQDGSLEQVVRNLDLTEESNQVEYLKKAIYKSAQVPMDDSASTGSLESGVALKILYSQLEEVVSRLRDSWIRTEQEVLGKALRYQRLLDGKSDPKEALLIEVVYKEDLVPQDEQHQLDIDLRLLENNLVTRESLIRKYNKTEDEIKTLLAQVPVPVQQSAPPANKVL